LAALFRGLIYKPVFETINPSIRENAKASAVARALKSGQISFQGDLFLGRFTAEISRELKAMGAMFDRVRKGYRITPSKLPPNILLTAVQARRETAELVESVFDTLATIPNQVYQYVQDIDFSDDAAVVEEKEKEKFVETVTRAIAVQPKINPRMRDQLKDQYTQNVTRSIKDFSQAETEKLRELVEAHVKDGRPRDELIRIVKARLRVSDGRAAFIAAQETRLFTSKLKQSQYENAGIKTYRWKTVGDSRVRTLHKRLNNTIQAFAKPPVIDERTGERGHPGEAFGCRCVASPIVEFES
jgi:SPP1 gp7 family putative phage head morphogenesis protein